MLLTKEIRRDFWAQVRSFQRFSKHLGSFSDILVETFWNECLIVYVKLDKILVFLKVCQYMYVYAYTY